MRKRRVLFTACLTACTFAGAAAAVHATAHGLGQAVVQLSSANLHGALLIGGLGGQILGLMMSGVLITAGDAQGLTIHAAKGAAWSGVVTAILIWLPMWVFVASCAAC